MPDPQSVNSLLARSVLLQLYFCQKALDILGMDIAAAHVDAAIQSFRNADSQSDIQSWFGATDLSQFDLNSADGSSSADGQGDAHR